MRLKLLIPAILVLIGVSAITTMTVLATSTGNPGGADSLHPDHSNATHDANRIVHVPCAIGGHSKHVSRRNAEVPTHIHFSTYYWFDSAEDDPGAGSPRVIELRYGMAHDNSDRSITEWGSYGTVGWNDTTDRFTFTGSDTTGKGKYTSDRIDYCNRLIAAGGNDGAYPTFEDVPDVCEDYFKEARHPRELPSGGL